MSDIIYPGTATPAQVLAGRTYSAGTNYNAAGTMPNNGKVIITPGVQQTIPQGYHDGTGYVAAGYGIGSKVSVKNMNQLSKTAQKIGDMTQWTTGYGIYDIVLDKNLQWILVVSQVSSGAVYSLTKYDMSGNVLWRFTPSSGGYSSAGYVGVSQNGQYVAFCASNIFLLNMSTGAVIWQNTYSISIGSGGKQIKPVVTNAQEVYWYNYTNSSSIYLYKFAPSNLTSAVQSNSPSSSQAYMSMHFDESTQLFYALIGTAMYYWPNNSTAYTSVTLSGVTGTMVSNGSNGYGALGDPASDYVYLTNTAGTLYKISWSQRAVVWSVNLTTMPEINDANAYAYYIISASPDDTFVLVGNQNDYHGALINAADGTGRVNYMQDANYWIGALEAGSTPSFYVFYRASNGAHIYKWSEYLTIQS